MTNNRERERERDNKLKGVSLPTKPISFHGLGKRKEKVEERERTIK